MPARFEFVASPVGELCRYLFRIRQEEVSFLGKLVRALAKIIAAEIYFQLLHLSETQSNSALLSAASFGPLCQKRS